ncbi:hypothetical protein FJTKL_14872 [Diaporthe vaccinii]|uniref:Uncharacterized protein n=1 Tax=Diaporthe vaccinii TaxID=105482 RepID=A0ABR4F8G6_9PEZI
MYPQIVSRIIQGGFALSSQSGQGQVTFTFVELLLATRLFNFLELGAPLYYFNDNAGQQKTPMSNSHHESLFFRLRRKNPARRRKARMQQASQRGRQGTRPEKQNKQLA